jgi:hypothetical protein
MFSTAAGLSLSVSSGDEAQDVSNSNVITTINILHFIMLTYNLAKLTKLFILAVVAPLP